MKTSTQTHDIAQQPRTNSPTSGLGIKVVGGRPLKGRVRIGGAKNAMLPIMAAALLTDEPCILENVPILNDIYVMADLLRALGAEVQIDEEQHHVRIHAHDIKSTTPPEDLVGKMRASFLVSGPILARVGTVETVAPGGCKLGSRPVDVDVRGFRRMGGDIFVGDGFYRMESSRLQGAEIYMDYPSHTGTENLLMAATLAQGTTTIINAAAEPEIGAVVDVLTDMGANVSGRGTHVLQIQGVERLRGFHTTILPDRLEAGTFAIAAAITNGELILDQVAKDDMAPLTAKLSEAGAEVWWSDSSMLVRNSGQLQPLEIQALPFPGFPTDLQAAIAVLLTQANGESRIFDRVYNDRLRYLSELESMGAKYAQVSNQEARILGPSKLHGAEVTALDIRSGACLVLAGLIAEGETTIRDIDHLRRGYEDIVSKFLAVGADITYV